MKTRLNSFSRERLHNLAKDIVACPKEKAALDKAYAAAEKVVLIAVEKRWPAADMEVLKKYDLHRSLKAAHTSGNGAYINFEFAEGTERLCAQYQSNRPVILSDKDIALVVTWEKAKAAYNESIQKKLADYKALINGSRNFEDVLEVWPEADKVRGDIGLNAVSTELSADVVKRIKADVAARSRMVKEAA